MARNRKGPVATDRLEPIHDASQGRIGQLSAVLEYIQMCNCDNCRRLRLECLHELARLRGVRMADVEEPAAHGPGWF